MTESRCPTYRIFNVRTDVNACDLTQGCTDTVRESVLKVDCGRKIPCRTGESSLPQRRADATLYQLSYIPTPRDVKQHLLCFPTDSHHNATFAANWAPPPPIYLSTTDSRDIRPSSPESGQPQSSRSLSLQPTHPSTALSCAQMLMHAIAHGGVRTP